jgi:hypothetical protein
LEADLAMILESDPVTMNLLRQIESAVVYLEEKVEESTSKTEELGNDDVSADLDPDGGQDGDEEVGQESLDVDPEDLASALAALGLQEGSGWRFYRDKDVAREREIGRIFNLEAHAMHGNCTLPGHNCRLFVNMRRRVRVFPGGPWEIRHRSLQQCLLLMYRFFSQGSSSSSVDHERLALEFKREWDASF